MAYIPPFILMVLGAYLSVYILYDLMLLIVHFTVREKQKSYATPAKRFAIIIPAHNEELLLERLLVSIANQDYPRALYRAIVVADNCSDNTAAIGRKHKAQVLERADDQLRGKGYAIKYALERIDMNEYDAVFIVDADSAAGSDLLRQLDRSLRNGARSIQCYNGLANPDQSWFTRLLDVSRTIGNEILMPAKQKLGLSSNLMGNGMCFNREVLSKYGWDAFTVGEDWEFYAKLVQAGETVSFANKARVYHQESLSLKQATTQRMRWSGGRFNVIKNYGFDLLRKGVVERNLHLIDASFPLLMPNPSLGINITVVCLILSALLFLLTNNLFFLLWYTLLVLLQVFIFLVGIMYTRNKLKKLSSLFIAPLFLAWKMGIDILAVLGIGNRSWIRTERKL